MGSVLSSPSASSSLTTTRCNDGGGCESNTALQYHHEELIMMNSSYDCYNTTDRRMADGNSNGVRETASAVVAVEPQNFTSTMAGVIVVSSLTTLLPISATIGYLYWVRSQQLRQYNRQLTHSLIETHKGRRMEHSKRIRAEKELKSTIQQCQTVLDQRRHERKRSSESTTTRDIRSDDDDSKCSTPKQQQQQRRTSESKLQKPSLPQLQVSQDQKTMTHDDHHHYDERIAISPKLSRSLSQQGEDEIEVELVHVDDDEEETSVEPQHHAQRDDHEDVVMGRQSFSYEDGEELTSSRRSSSMSLRPRRSMSNNNFSHRSSSITSEEEGLILGGEEARFLAPPSPPSSTSTSLHSRSSSIHSRSSSIVSTSSMRSHSRSLSVSSNWSTATVASECMMPTQDKVLVPYVPYEMKSLEEDNTMNDTNTKISHNSYLLESTTMNSAAPEQVAPLHKNKVDNETPDLIQISTVSTELPTTSFDSTGISSSWSVSTSEQQQQRRKAQHNIASTIKSPPSLSVTRNWKNETVVAREDNSKKSKNNDYKKNLAEQQSEHPYMNNMARMNKKAEIRNKLVGRIRRNVTEKLAEQTTKGKGLELSLSPTTVFRTPMVRRKTQHYANIHDMEYMM